MKPTTRFVLDSSRSCNIKCKFCYYLHTYDKWKEYDWSLDKAKGVIDSGIARGNDYMDVTGGEPTMYKHICEVVAYALSKNVKTCIITNGIVPSHKAEKLISAGIDEFLVSRHGLEDTHDFTTNCRGAYRKQLNFLHVLDMNEIPIRFNCVINHFNQHDIYEIAKELVQHKPRIVNFINMNPHHEWQDKNLETKKVAADLNVVEPLLNKAIKLLEDCGIGVNVRYYPMCRIAEEYRRCICNDLHVVFDPYEWDYNIEPKTVQAFDNWGKRTSSNVECKNGSCKECDLQNICGGINKAFDRATDYKYTKPVKNFKENKEDFYFYRKDNIRTIT
ncbi:radical SAM protein [Candidatus Peregrinibacteria bacterium]|nr:radical SAM protein [Candidatus Peregrinibacteria bacterium]